MGVLVDSVAEAEAEKTKARGLLKITNISKCFIRMRVGAYSRINRSGKHESVMYC